MVGRVLLGSCVAFLFAFAPLAAAFAQAPAEKQEAEAPKTVATEFAARLKEIEAEIVKLNTAGNEELAKSIESDLASLRQRMNDKFALPPLDADAEVHHLSLAEGGPAPAGLLKGAERFTTGYAEVRVTRVGKPVILMLECQRPVHWKLEIAPDVQVMAIVTMGGGRGEVAGALAGVPIFRSSSNSRGENVADVEGRVTLDLKQWTLKETGAPLLTSQQLQRYAGEPLIVGPENEIWRAQCLLPEAVALLTKARQPQRTKTLASLADLRFPAHFRVPEPPTQYPRDRGPSAYGEFSVHGPIAATLRPLPANLRYLVKYVADGEPVTFAVQGNAGLVTYDPFKENAYPKVPVDGKISETEQIFIIALDTKRDRLVCVAGRTAKALVVLDLKTNQWSKLYTSPVALSALTYNATDDKLYALGSVSGTNHTLFIFDGNSQEPEKAPLTVSVPTSNLPIQFSHLSLDINCVNGLLAIAAPPATSDPRGNITAPAKIAVYDIKARELIYEGPQQIDNGQNRVVVGTSPAPPKATGAPAQMLQKLKQAAELVANARKSDAAAADRLALQLAAIRAALGGDLSGLKSDKPLLHVVGFYSPGNAEIEVTDTTRPVVLVLLGYDPAQWTVRVAEGVKVERIIVSGYHTVQINGVPADVPVEVNSQEGKMGTPLPYVYAREKAQYTEAEAALKERTGLEIATFFGTYRYSGTPVIVGPENIQWRQERAQANLDQLLAESERQKQAAQRIELQNLKFQARYSTRGDADHFAGLRGMLGGKGFSFGEFTPAGPIQETLREFPVDVKDYAGSLNDPVFYYRNDHDLFRYSTKTGESTKLIPDGRLPISWPTAICLDPLRNRLLVKTRNSIYAYALDTETWSLLSARAPELRTLKYCPAEDCFYGIASPEHGDSESLTVPTLVKLNAHMAEISILPLAIKQSQLRRLGMIQDLQCVGDRIVLITQERPARSEGRRPPLPGDKPAPPPIQYANVIDSRTAEVVYSGTIRPRAASKMLSKEEIDKLWQALADRDEAAADLAAWRIAAGGMAVVEYLTEKFKPAPFDAAVAEKLIEELDDDKFDVRDKAFTALLEMGPELIPLLEKRADDPALERKTRVKQLLDGQRGEQLNPRLLRQINAIRALQRIENPAALALLQRLAKEAPDKKVSAAATSAVEQAEKTP